MEERKRGLLVVCVGVCVFVCIEWRLESISLVMFNTCLPLTVCVRCVLEGMNPQ